MSAAEMLPLAALEQGAHAQVVASIGSERTGAAVVGFCRIDDQDLRRHEPILAPDMLIVQDPRLLHEVDMFQGLQPDGYLHINSLHGFGALGLAEVEQRYRRERLVGVWLCGTQVPPAVKHGAAIFERPMPWNCSDAPRCCARNGTFARRTSRFDELQGDPSADNALFEVGRCLSCGNGFRMRHRLRREPGQRCHQVGPGNCFGFDCGPCKGRGIGVVGCPCGAIDTMLEEGWFRPLAGGGQRRGGGAH